jgi:hypothetical protein
MKNREIFLDSLGWFEGGTQKRNIGIAIVESEWDKKDNKDFRSRWTSVLTNQAVYLLTRKPTKGKEKEPVFHEEQNLIRIMDILMEKADVKENYKNEFLFLTYAFKNHINNPESKKLKHLNQRIKELNYQKKEKWINYFSDKNSEMSKLLDDFFNDVDLSKEIEAKKQVETEKQRIEKEAYLLWEADGKPEGKDDYYWDLAKLKLKRLEIERCLNQFISIIDRY